MTGFFGKGGAAVNVEVPDGFEARWVDGVLKLVDLDKEKNLIDARKDRVMTFMDACEKLGNDDKLVQNFFRIKKALGGFNDVSSSAVAYLRLRIISRALKVGLPDVDSEGCMYLPSINFYTSKDREYLRGCWKSLADVPEDYKLQWPALLDCSKFEVIINRYSNALRCGPACRINGPIPSCMLFPSEGLARHFVEQFMGIWIEYLYGD